MSLFQKIIHNEDNICRQCLNNRYGINLVPDECRYSTYSMPCPACGELHQIPIRFSLRGRMKILLRRRKKAQRTEVDAAE